MATMHSTMSVQVCFGPQWSWLWACINNRASLDLGRTMGSSLTLRTVWRSYLILPCVIHSLHSWFHTGKIHHRASCLAEVWKYLVASIDGLRNINYCACCRWSKFGSWLLVSLLPVLKAVSHPAMIPCTRLYLVWGSIISSTDFRNGRLPPINFLSLYCDSEYHCHVHLTLKKLPQEGQFGSPSLERKAHAGWALLQGTVMPSSMACSQPFPFVAMSAGLLSWPMV